MIQMRMRQDDRIDGCGIEWKIVAIMLFVRPAALNQPAIDQHTLITAGDEIAGTGDFPGCTEKLNIHLVCSIRAV